MAVSRQSEHDANGRKDSRERRAEEAVQAALASCRSCEVKTGRLVFLLPERSESWTSQMCDGRIRGAGLLCDIVVGYARSMRSVDVLVKVLKKQSGSREVTGR